jgi:hypothetical protein
MNQEVTMNQKPRKARKTIELQRKQADIRACLEYLQPQAAKAGLREVAFWIGVARLAASETAGSGKVVGDR